MGKKMRYPAEVRDRAVGLVIETLPSQESEWSAVVSVASKIVCATATLHAWLRRAQSDTGKRPGVTTAERERVKELERENRELKRANEILRMAAAFFS